MRERQSFRCCMRQEPDGLDHDDDLAILLIALYVSVRLYDLTQREGAVDLRGELAGL